MSRLTETLEVSGGQAVPPYPHRLLLMLDEFPTLGRMEVIQTALAYLAGYGIKFNLIMKPAEGVTDFFAVVREFISSYPQRGLLIVISDFLDDQGCEKPLQYLSDFGHELLLIQVWADEDRTPPWDGDLDLTDAESGQRLEIAFGPAARQSYTEAFDRWSRSLQEAVMRKGGRYAGISTSTPVEAAIFGPLAASGAVE